MVKTHLIGDYAFFYYAGMADAYYKGSYIGGFPTTKATIREDSRIAYRRYRRISRNF